MLRSLIQKKEKIRSQMAELWKAKESSEWTKEQRADYDKHSEAVKKLDDDIKLRSDYVETFQAELPKADKDFQSLERKASFFNLIKRELFESTNDSRFKIDSGPIKEVIAEREKNIPDQFRKTGDIPFQLYPTQKRATISTASGSGEDLKEETIYPDIVPNLYEKAWAGRIGATFIENWRGDFILPGEKDKPASGFVAETADYSESSMDYEKAISLKPLKVGALQPFSLQSFMQDETRQLQNSINSQLMKEWAKKVDDDFLNADGNPVTEPKGLLNITGIQELEAGTGADGSNLTFAKLIECEGLFTSIDQDSPPTWLINAKTLTHARSTLRNTVAGSLYIGNNRQIADRKFVMSNVVKSNLTKGSSGATLSQAILVVPESVVVVQWAMPVVSIDRSLGFKSDTVWTKISGYVNIGLKRPKDFINLKNIKTTA